MKSKKRARSTGSDKIYSVQSVRKTHTVRAAVAQLWSDGYTPAEIAKHVNHSEKCVRTVIAGMIQEGA